METDLAGQFAELEKENQRLRAEIEALQPMNEIVERYFADAEKKQLTHRVRLWSGPKEHVERLLAFVREQFCECVNEHGQNRRDGPCERCVLLGEDNRIKMPDDRKCPLCGTSHIEWCLNVDCQLPCRLWNRIEQLQQELDEARVKLKARTEVTEPFMIGEDDA